VINGIRLVPKVHPDLGKLWMQFDSTVLRRGTSEAAAHVFVSNGEIWPILAESTSQTARVE